MYYVKNAENNDVKYNIIAHLEHSHDITEKLFIACPVKFTFFITTLFPRAVDIL